MTTGKPPSKHTSVRLKPAILERVDALIPDLSTPWYAAKRADVLRALIVAGLDVLEARRDEKRRRS